MSTAVTAATATATEQQVAVSPVTFPRVLHSEWIKLWSLRSTYWSVVATVLAMVLIATVMALAAAVGAAGADDAPGGEAAIGLGYTFAQVVVAVLGALMITGEYSTGMIRSSLAAAPRRTPVLAAKAVLIAAVGFLLGVLGVALAYLVTLPVLGGQDAADLADPEVQRIFWGTGLYLAGVGLLGLGLGALIRHTAGAITAALGVLLLLSTVVQLLMLTSDWFTGVYPYLPSTAGERIASPEVTAAVDGGPVVLAPWTGFAVFMAYVAVTLIGAAVSLRRRDA
ncbi:ABC transporter permease subunit [Blastococcus tunisiensis]|uniref:ABC-2 type transport system permease protein n=1 Tax=Blastococcus tunisiensis TaxID=1798228 RepID=A0A1I2IQR8_9ACTN|nr:ABC transporter permease subunit [Blastococcus sp. DSM 46838]SFF42861.1 ABC-2 type transport system permease protein [Blastococcus sp. DSM 46838]